MVGGKHLPFGWCHNSYAAGQAGEIPLGWVCFAIRQRSGCRENFFGVFYDYLDGPLWAHP